DGDRRDDGDRGRRPGRRRPGRGDARCAPHGDHDAAGGHLRRHPQRDDHGRRAAAPDERPRGQRLDGAVAVDGLPADHGRGHPHHRLPAAAAGHQDGVRAGDEPLLRRHPAGRGLPGLLDAAGRPGRPGRRHGDHAAAADDDDPHAGARRPPRRRDGQRQHRHLGRAGHRPDGLRGHPAVPLVALHVRDRAADRPGGPGARRPPARQRQRAGAAATGPGFGAAVRARLRRPGVRAEPAGRGGRREPQHGPGLPGRRRPLPGGLRLAAAAAGSRRRPAAGPARLPFPDVQRQPHHAVHRHGRAVRRDHPAADLPPERPRARLPADRPAAPARWPADGPARPGRRPAVRPLGSPRPVDLRLAAARGDALAAQHGRRRHPGRAAGRIPPGHVAGSGLPVHAGVHHGAEPAAAVALLPRQRDPLHPAAGRRRRRHRAAGGDHGRPERDAGRGRQLRRRRPGRGPADGVPRRHGGRGRSGRLRAVPPRREAGRGRRAQHRAGGHRGPGAL
ncbi:MAG: Uncharacterized MFS-type transporter, partial [uncultured Friedmanniella sp.]